jgi:von Willebrand factor type A domain
VRFANPAGCGCWPWPSPSLRCTCCGPGASGSRSARPTCGGSWFSRCRPPGRGSGCGQACCCASSCWRWRRWRWPGPDGRSTTIPLAEHTVFIVDASGSMAARDGDPDRLADAKRVATDLFDELPAGGVASVVVASDHPRVAVTATPDGGAFADALAPIATSGGGADWTDAFLLAESLETAGLEIGFQIISDGGLTPADQRPAGVAGRGHRRGAAAGGLARGSRPLDVVAAPGDDAAAEATNAQAAQGGPGHRRADRHRRPAARPQARAAWRVQVTSKGDWPRRASSNARRRRSARKGRTRPQGTRRVRGPDDQPSNTPTS